ncbi:MAG: FAD-dependent oxidoreductase, partial [Pontimonas sp.]
MMVDTIVVGGGPAGLTCASLLPGNTLVLERRRQVGGCHRVQYDSEGRFSEHGPRVYSGGYVNLDRMLSMIGLRWTDVFAPVHYAPDDIDGQRWYQWLSWRGLLMVTLMTLAYMLGVPIEGSVKSAAEWWRLSAKERRNLDTVCRFSDGAGDDRYRQSQFVAGFDFHAVYPFYEPRESLDYALWRPWTEWLRSRGVRVETGARVSRVLISGGRAVGVRTANGREILARRVVVCLPPKPLMRLLRDSEVYAYPDLKKTQYIPYWSYSLHFEPGEGPLVEPGFRDTAWGLIYMDLSRHLVNQPTAILSVAITRVDRVPKGVSDDRIETELLRQLPLLPEARRRLVAVVPTRESDHAYVNAVGTRPIPFEHPHVEGLATVGCANGRSRYPFTSIESAIQNAMVFCGHRPRHPWTIRSIAIVALI